MICTTCKINQAKEIPDLDTGIVIFRGPICDECFHDYVKKREQYHKEGAELIARWEKPSASPHTHN